MTLPGVDRWIEQGTFKSFQTNHLGRTISYVCFIMGSKVKYLPISPDTWGVLGTLYMNGKPVQIRTAKGERSLLGLVFIGVHLKRHLRRNPQVVCTLRLVSV
jgi:hypothetical protein